jgi:hypothetical protein
MYQLKRKDIDAALLAMGGKLADAAEVPVLGTAESGSGGRVTFINKYNKTIPKNAEEAAELHAKLALLGLQLSEFLPPAEYKKLGLPRDEMNAAPSTARVCSAGLAGHRAHRGGRISGGY